MRTLRAAALAASLVPAFLVPAFPVPALAWAGPTYDVTLSPGRQINVDLGCTNGYVEGSRWPTVVYDQKAHERITYNISRCTGGFIRGVNQDSGRVWRADIRPDGGMSGQDLDGSKWRYDPKVRLYTNLTTGRSCGQTSLRRVCAG